MQLEIIIILKSKYVQWNRISNEIEWKRNTNATTDCNFHRILFFNKKLKSCEEKVKCSKRNVIINEFVIIMAICQ